MLDEQGHQARSDLDRSFEAISKEIADLNGLKTEKAKDLATRLALAFLKAITTLPTLHGVEEWRMVAYMAKKVPVCRHPCLFTKDLERILARAGFSNFHYFMIEEALSRTHAGPSSTPGDE